MSAERAPSPASDPTHGVAVRRDLRVPVRDGLELSANLWLPVGAVDDAAETAAGVPVILEMIPYRKDDWRASGDAGRGTWWAARGYAFCRLDIRGTGSSPGIARDEYTAEETTDGYDAVEWLAAQPWCNGNVAMWGISYGGFTAIQVAMLRPPHLRAIVPMYATDDRYTDDVHYVGGAVTASELSQYAVSMVGMNALPPRPSYRGERWLDEWRERLELTPVWLIEWLRRQADGPYWRQGSLAPDYDAIEVPILLFAGWMDGYVNPALRMLERCTAPRRAIVGNWVHSFPDDAYPGPNMDWLHEMLRFLDHWLKGVPNGVPDDAPLAWFRREWAAPEPFPASWPGAWQTADAFPIAGTHLRTFFLDAGSEPLRGRLVDTPPSGAGIDILRHRATHGTWASLSWGAGSAPNGLWTDPRAEDGLVPAYTSDPLDEPLDICGFPTAVLAWRSPVTVATAVVRLLDVAPDGTPTQVTAGVLNLTHRNGHHDPRPLEPGATAVVEIPMRAAGYRFRAGHRVRLTVASAYWPVIWPSPDPADHELLRGGARGAGSDASVARLVLPVVPSVDTADPGFKTTRLDLPDVGAGSEDPPTWRVSQDVIAGTTTVRIFDGGESIAPDGTTLYSSEAHDLTASDQDPAHATMASEVVYRLRQDGHAVDVLVTGRTSSDRAAFRIEGTLHVTLDGDSFFERTWDESLPRRLV
ncbi:MAG: CocE/NonD family hydrolase [Chloroflexota bacterium]